MLEWRVVGSWVAGLATIGLVGVVESSGRLGKAAAGPVHEASTSGAATWNAPAPVFEELYCAVLATRGENDARWELAERADLTVDVLRWLDDRIGPTIDFDDGVVRDEPPICRGPLWRALLPDGLELFVQELRFMRRSPSQRLFFLRDPVSGRMSTEPAEVTCRWDDTGQPKMPIRLHLVQLDEHAPWQIGVRCYGHNGTFYNAERMVYLEPDTRGPTPEIRTVLAMDTAVQWPFDTRDGCAPDGVFSSRLLRDRGVLRLDHWYEHPGLGVGRRPAARGRYVRKQAGEAFELVDLVILDENSPLPK